MRRGQGNRLQTLPITVPITEEALNLSWVANVAGIDVSTLHRWRRHKRIEIELPAGCVVVIRRK